MESIKLEHTNAASGDSSALYITSSNNSLGLSLDPANKPDAYLVDDSVSFSASRHLVMETPANSLKGSTLAFQGNGVLSSGPSRTLKQLPKSDLKLAASDASVEEMSRGFAEMGDSVDTHTPATAVAVAPATIAKSAVADTTNGINAFNVGKTARLWTMPMQGAPFLGYMDRVGPSNDSDIAHGGEVHEGLGIDQRSKPYTPHFDRDQSYAPPSMPVETYAISPFDLTHSASYENHALKKGTPREISLMSHYEPIEDPKVLCSPSSLEHYGTPLSESAGHGASRMSPHVIGAGTSLVSGSTEFGEGSLFLDKTRAPHHHLAPHNLAIPNFLRQSADLSRAKHRPPSLHLDAPKNTANNVMFPGNVYRPTEIQSAVLSRDLSYDLSLIGPATGYMKRDMGFYNSRYYSGIPTATSLETLSYSGDLPHTEPGYSGLIFSSSLRPDTADMPLHSQSGIKYLQYDHSTNHMSPMPQQASVRGLPSVGHEYKTREQYPGLRLGLPLSSDLPKKHTRRRLLPRSKSGCWICRIKHLKCDEARPACSLCQKFGLECDYSPQKPAYVVDPALRLKMLSKTSFLRRLKRTTPEGPKRRRSNGASGKRSSNLPIDKEDPSTCKTVTSDDQPQFLFPRTKSEPTEMT